VPFLFGGTFGVGAGELDRDVRKGGFGFGCGRWAMGCDGRADEGDEVADDDAGDAACNLAMRLARIW
jgi:hypothetical protein